jgi:hypothetical protein
MRLHRMKFGGQGDLAPRTCALLLQLSFTSVISLCKIFNAGGRMEGHCDYQCSFEGRRSGRENF